MARCLQISGLCLVLVLVGSVIGTSSAAAWQFHSEIAPLKVTGSIDSGADVFELDAGTVSCSTVSYTGTVGNLTATTWMLSPSYSGCIAFGFANTVISMNGCEYLLHAEATEGGINKGSMDIACPSGKEVTIVVSSFGTTKCTIHIPPQTGLRTLRFTNIGTGTTREITVDLNISGAAGGGGLKYSQTAGTGFGACSNATNTSLGSYNGLASLTGEADFGTEGHVGIYAQ